ncbi:hypothetical protein C8R42DRAFT_290463 [Lentinula raphanica]|nr:hypothetical protein C8R42DRAFT_290463 [Lentinula raphanica]
MDFLRTSRTFLLTLVPLPSSDTCISHTRASLLNLNCGLLNYRIFVSVRTHSALPVQRDTRTPPFISQWVLP